MPLTSAASSGVLVVGRSAPALDVGLALDELDVPGALPASPLACYPRTTAA